MYLIQSLQLLTYKDNQQKKVTKEIKKYELFKRQIQIRTNF